MNKEKKDVIERVKQMVADGQMSQDVVERYFPDFPELEEYGDERVRQDLLTLCINLRNGDCVYPPDKPEILEKAISWLEKQGQVKESEISQHENKSCKEICYSLTRDEDERIRKAIIEHFKYHIEEMKQYGSDDYEAEIEELSKYIAWLEKQGEQKTILDAAIVFDWLKKHAKSYVKCEYNEFHHTVEYDGSINVDEMVSDLECYLGQSEQEPAYTVDAPLCESNNGKPVYYEDLKSEDIDAEKASEEYRKYRMSCGITDPVMLGEIESAYYEGATRQISDKWSESDKDRIKELVALIRHSNYTNGVKRKVISWIESLKDRIVPQPKQEWSEEDENGLGNALWAIQQARTIAKDENDMGNLWSAEKWLRTLKERLQRRGEEPSIVKWARK